MLVYLLKDVEKVGMAGSTVKVAEGFAKNFLIPKGFAKTINENEKTFLTSMESSRLIKKEVIASKMGMMAERINNMHIALKKRAHEGKLYGSIAAIEIIDALKPKGIMVNKKQIEFNKSIKTTGEHVVTIRLNSKISAELQVKIIEDKQLA